MSEIAHSEEEGLVYADVRYGILDSATAPADCECAEFEDLRLSYGEEDYRLSDLLEEEKIERIEEIPELLEEEYEEEFRLLSDYKEAEELNRDKDYGWKKWVWPFGLSYFHQQKEKFALKEMELRDNGMEKEAEELNSQYMRDFGKGMAVDAGLAGATLTAAYFEQPELTLLGLTSLFLWHNYGEMWHGMKIQSEIEKDKYQVDE